MEFINFLAGGWPVWLIGAVTCWIFAFVRERANKAYILPLSVFLAVLAGEIFTIAFCLACIIHQVS